MFRAIRKQMNPATVLAFVALVFALTGGAFAATGGGGNSGGGAHATLTASTAKAKAAPKGKAGPRGPAGVKGATGVTGATGGTGPAGATGPGGPAGAKGENGAAGATGPAGAAGPQGTPGAEGPEGSPWTAGGTLPKGSQETGVWVASKTPAGESGEIEYGAISFTIPLAAALASSNVHYITIAEVEARTAVPGCSGDAEEPVAAPGTLCVFEGGLSSPVGGVLLKSILKPGATGVVPTGEGAGQTGALVRIFPKEPESEYLGSWAVRGA